jgi:hypothetical protein
LEELKGIQARWSNPEDVFASALGMPRPTFHLLSGATIFTIGSCFARSIEAALQRRGLDIPMLDFSVPKTEFPYRPNGLLNRYTVPSIAQGIRWTDAIASGRSVSEASSNYFIETTTGTIDLDLVHFVPVTLARAVERREQIYHVWSKAFFADTVVITLGQNEVWRLLSRDVVWGIAPGTGDLTSWWADTHLETPGYESLLETLLGVVDLIRLRQPRTRFLLTVSPVPGTRYFNGLDALTSYWWSKSLLRSVAAAATEARPDIDYFPSFELVQAIGRSAFGDDGIHVRLDVVDQIVSRLLSTYLIDPAEETQRAD